MKDYAKLQEIRQQLIEEIRKEFPLLTTFEVLQIAEYRLQTFVSVDQDEKRVERETKQKS